MNIRSEIEKNKQKRSGLNTLINSNHIILDFLHYHKRFTDKELDRHDFDKVYRYKSSGNSVLFLIPIGVILALIFIFKGNALEYNHGFLIPASIIFICLLPWLILNGMKTELTINSNSLTLQKRGKVKFQTDFNKCEYLYFKRLNNTEYLAIILKNKTTHKIFLDGYKLHTRELGLVIYSRMKETKHNKV